MVAIYLHQLRDHLMSSRFQVSLMILLVFFGTSGLVYVWKLEKLQREIILLDRIDEQRYRQISTVSQGTATWFRNQGNHPQGTEFIVDGGIDLLSTVLWTPTSTGTAPNLWRAYTRNAVIDNFQVFDWSLVVRFVISFLCIVLAYDTVSRELESGTLRLLLSNPVSRAQYVIGKGLAHLSAVLVGVLAGALVSLTVLSVGGSLSWSAGLLGDLLLLLAGVAVYSIIFICLAMGVSAVARSSAASAVVLFVVWTISVVILPQMSAMIGLQAADVPYSPGQAADDYYSQTQQTLAERGLTFRGVEVGAIDDYAQERELAQHLREAEVEHNRIYRDVGRQQSRQWEIARAINLLSPAYAFQYGIEAVLGVGVVHRDALDAQNWQYRDALREFWQRKDGADPASPQIRFFPDYMSTAELDHREIPRFTERRLTLAEGIAAGAGPLLILFLEMVVGVLFVHWALLRTELSQE